MRVKKDYYEADFLEKQVSFYRSLPEKQRRHFLAMEHQRLGKDSKRYICRVFGCHHLTINKGLAELAESDYTADYSRQRKAGGGRKKRSDTSGIEKLDT